MPCRCGDIAARIVLQSTRVSLARQCGSTLPEASEGQAVVVWWCIALWMQAPAAYGRTPIPTC